jgi:hypothetical protein
MRWIVVWPLLTGCVDVPPATDDTDDTDVVAYDTPDTEGPDSDLGDSDPKETEAPDSDPADSEPPDSDTTVTADSDTTEPPPVDTGPPPDPCMTAPSAVELGTGEQQLVPVGTGDHVEMVHGPQGGWHFWASIRASHTPQFVHVVIDTTHVPTGARVSFLDLIIALVPDPPPAQPGTWTCEGGFSGLFAILDTTAVQAGVPPWQAICGDEVLMHLSLTTLDGHLIGEDAVRFIAQPDPTDGPHCTP